MSLHTPTFPAEYHHNKAKRTASARTRNRNGIQNQLVCDNNLSFFFSFLESDTGASDTLSSYSCSADFINPGCVVVVSLKMALGRICWASQGKYREIVAA